MTFLHNVLLLLALVWPSIMTWLYFVVFAGMRWMAAVYGVGKLTQFALPVVYWWLVGRRPDWRQLLSTRLLVPAVGFGVFVAVAVGAVYPYLSAQESLVERIRQQAVPRLAALQLATPAGYFSLVVFYSLVHSLLEEYYWRWFVYAELRRRLVVPAAIGLASAAFAAHHVIVLWVYFQSIGPTAFFSACVMVGGAVWCWFYERSGGSLLGIWLSHLIVDAAILTAGWFWVAPVLAD